LTNDLMRKLTQLETERDEVFWRYNEKWLN
jgi:hypothetical protein